MDTYLHLTTRELIAQLNMRVDLTDLELELVARLERATDEIDTLVGERGEAGL